MLDRILRLRLEGCILRTLFVLSSDQFLLDTLLAELSGSVGLFELRRLLLG